MTTINSAASQEFCKDVITIPQFTGTCWFNALLMTLFYSDGVREFLKKQIKTGEIKKNNKKLYSVLKDVLENRHLNINNQDSVYFNELKPENILKILHEEDNKTFYFNPDNHTGHWGEYYLVRLLEYIGMKKNSLFLEYVDDDSYPSFYYSVLNGEPDLVIEKTYKDEKKSFFWRYTSKSMKFKVPADPDVLIVTNMFTKSITKSTKNIAIKNDDPKDKIKEIITYNGSQYKLDGMLLTNFNFNQCSKGHQIAGVTCKDKRYMYNGWITGTADPAKKGEVSFRSPCSLMKYDWLDNKHNFCISKKSCGLEQTNDKTDLCFNTNKGTRTFFYVKINETIPKVKTPEIKFKVDCHKNKIFNPDTGRCVSKTSKKGKELVKESGEKPECPEKKIFNPKSGRCVLKTSKRGKEILESKDEKSDDKKSKNKKSNKKKECPEKKILNPDTGRCVLKTSNKGKELLKST
jgi:hypothetical protein